LLRNCSFTIRNSVKGPPNRHNFVFSSLSLIKTIVATYIFVLSKFEAGKLLSSILGQFLQHIFFYCFICENLSPLEMNLALLYHIWLSLLILCCTRNSIFLSLINVFDIFNLVPSIIFFGF
jgi:hypothetical protein